MNGHSSMLGTEMGIAGVRAGEAVIVRIEPATDHRNRLTCAFRPLLAIPHLLLVGGPLAAALWWTSGVDETRYRWGTGGGVLGAVAAVCALIAWFAIVFGARHPQGLWNLAAFYLRWRVRAVAYMALLRDEYPPFGDGPYAVMLSLEAPPVARHRLSVAFRIFLALPHVFVLWVLGIAWAVTTFIAWVSIVFTGVFPASLYEFGAGVLRWSTRVEAYLLLLHDEYPPFSLG
jgi:hypothetical protein